MTITSSELLQQRDNQTEHRRYGRNRGSDRVELQTVISPSDKWSDSCLHLILTSFTNLCLININTPLMKCAQFVEKK